MKKLKDNIKNLILYFADDNLPLETKSLYIITASSVPGSLIFLILFSVFGLPIEAIVAAVGMILFFACTLYILLRFEDSNFVRLLVVFVLNFLMFPYIFYITGDIYNGGILFFPLGILTTFFLIKDKIVYLITVVELIWYCVILYIPMVKYESFNEHRMVAFPGDGIISSFLLAAVVPIFVIMYQTKMYNKTHDQLEESRRVIQEAKYNKSRFLANMTHEIRTPMNAIIGMNELILREELDSETRELVENIKLSSNQLLKIINNVLEFSKLDSNKMEIYEQKYDFKKMMSEIIDSVSREYAVEESDFYADIDPNIPRILFGDNVRIKQVFMYILFSAISKLPHNRISLKVEGDVSYNTNSVKLACTIAESGLGMSEDEIEAMLSAYTRYDSRQKSDFKGMGLELSICKEILTMMGGNLSIDSVEGVGMAIHFEFINYIIEDIPLVKLSYDSEYSILVYSKNALDNDTWVDVLSPFQVYPKFVSGPNAFKNAIENRKYTHIFVENIFYEIVRDTIEAASIEDNVYIVSDVGNAHRNYGKCKIIRKPLNCINVADALNNVLEDNQNALSKKEMVTYPEAKVLIVDDSVVNLKVLEGMLKLFKIAVTKCSSGKEAIEVLEREEFDLLILDQRMPEMDGIELLHYIRGIGNVNSELPILCATADFGPELERTLKQEGFQDYLAKPVRKYYLERMLIKFLPQELAVKVFVDGDETTNKNEKAVAVKEENKVQQPDPLEINFETGLSNVGGNQGGFLDVLVSYYKEGLSKTVLVPDLMKSSVDSYVIEVHALKSSSAAIGAAGISVLFKDLEFAGRGNNTEYIEAHTMPTIDLFIKVLDKIKDYLNEHGIQIEENESEPEGEELKLEASAIEEVIDALAKFNLKLCEDKLKELVQVNYGKDVNKALKSILASYEQFDYHKVRDDLNALKDSI